MAVDICAKAPMMALLAVAYALQDVEWKKISFASGGAEVSAEIARPKGDGPFPAVIVIHEWWGLNDQIKGIAAKLVKEGYVALCPDLYRGKLAKDADEAHQLMRGLPEDRAVADLKAAFAFLQADKGVKPEKIGSVGFCMGGGYSVSLAMKEPALASCAVFYGRLPTDIYAIAALQAPLIGFFGDQDKGIPPEAVRTFEDVLKKYKRSVQTHIYKGAGHAFMNEKGKSYHAPSAKDAWEKLLAHFQKTLRG